jgi:soluble lytic murein transglycosylase
MGAYILSEELRRNDGDVLRSLAAYNAGPGNASFWWELAEGDPDLFVELISFRETQHYVRTITVQANHYRRLYPELR